MAQNVFDPNKEYVCSLCYGVYNQPRLIGHLAANTIEAPTISPFKGGEYAVFTVDEPTESRPFPPAWVGSYRLPMSNKDSWFVGQLLDNGSVINSNGNVIFSNNKF